MALMPTKLINEMLDRIEAETGVRPSLDDPETRGRMAEIMRPLEPIAEMSNKMFDGISDWAPSLVEDAEAADAIEVQASAVSDETIPTIGAEAEPAIADAAGYESIGAGIGDVMPAIGEAGARAGTAVGAAEAAADPGGDGFHLELLRAQERVQEATRQMREAEAVRTEAVIEAIEQISAEDGTVAAEADPAEADAGTSTEASAETEDDTESTQT